MHIIYDGLADFIMIDSYNIGPGRVIAQKTIITERIPPHFANQRRTCSTV